MSINTSMMQHCWLGRSLTRAVLAQSFKISCWSGNDFSLVYKDLLIDFGRTNFLQNRDMACKLGCGLLTLQLIRNENQTKVNTVLIGTKFANINGL